MPDDNDTTRRPRPFAPPAPPFPGPGAPPRAPAPGNAASGVKRPPPFVAARPAAAPAPVQAPAPPVKAPAAPLAASEHGSRSGREHARWDSTSRAPAAATPSIPVATAPLPAGEDPAPEEAAQALSGLPYIDNTGAAHDPHEAVPASRLSGKMHRVEHDVPGILEGVAARIRGGTLNVPNVDPFAGDAAVLTAVLAAMLRNREG